MIPRAKSWKTGIRDKQAGAGGFTLAELVIVVLILGVLAAVALPRFTDRSTFDAQGFYDQTQSAVRYAQNTAIAKRRIVYVVADTVMQVSTGAVLGRIRGCYDLLCMNPAFTPYPYRKLSDGTTTNDLLVESPGTVTLATALVDQTTGTPSAALSFSFDGLGRPSFTGAWFRFTITGTNARVFDVEPETGYVHI